MNKINEKKKLKKDNNKMWKKENEEEPNIKTLRRKLKKITALKCERNWMLKYE